MQTSEPNSEKGSNQNYEYQVNIFTQANHYNNQNICLMQVLPMAETGATRCAHWVMTTSGFRTRPLVKYAFREEREWYAQLPCADDVPQTAFKPLYASEQSEHINRT
jgi:hypothetical protein